MSRAYLVSARRTAVVPRQGAFARLSLPELAAPVVQHCLQDAGLAADQVDQLILGNALYAGGNPARVVALAAGLSERVAGLSIDTQCCSGLDAIALGARLIESGAAQVVLAGGAESYSRAPQRYRTDPDGGAAQPYQRPPFTPWPTRDPDMDVAAQALAERFAITRAAQDAWAVDSHAKAHKAASSMARELVPLAGQCRDPYTRRLSLKVAARARSLCGSVSLANTAVAADAAAFVLLVSESWLARLQPDRACRVVAAASLGGDPECPGIAPIAAIDAVLARSKLSAQALTCVEIMEAYAVQAMLCAQIPNFSPQALNRGGGALARGHPIGASGAVLAVRLFHTLQRGAGLAAIAAAGGIGCALLVQTVDSCRPLAPDSIEN